MAPHGSGVSPSCLTVLRRALASKTAGATKLAGLILLAANPFVPNGAASVLAEPPLQAAEANAVQSPAIIASVGTLAILLPGFSCAILSWKPPKRNNLFLMIGPPRVPPN